MQSQPSWAAWIEISFQFIVQQRRFISRSPLGLRGLKYHECNRHRMAGAASQPSWAAWIEI